VVGSTGRRLKRLERRKTRPPENGTILDAGRGIIGSSGKGVYRK
jgi:hypothetical protein